MEIVAIYSLGLGLCVLFSMLLLGILDGTKVADDFIQELGVEIDQIIATMSLLWPLTIVATIIFAVGYCLHALYVVIRAVIATVKVKIKNA